MNRESEDLPEQKGLTFVDRRWLENLVDKKGTSPD